MLINSNFIIYSFIVLTCVGAIAARKIDIPGGGIGGIITMLLFTSTGLFGIVLIGSFFIIGTLGSVYKIRQKTALSVAESNGSKRGWRNVLANSGAAAIVAFLDILFPGQIHAEILMAICFASALSDTLSSEMGNISGRKYFNIISMKPGIRGEDGVVSWAGFGWGLLGSGIISVVYWSFFASIAETLILFIIGFLGNIIDSILGATWQRNGLLDNHSVNFSSTTTATVIGWVVSLG